MRAFHNSRLSDYRYPYGAVEAGGAVHVSIDVFDAPDVTGRVKLWIDGEGETLVDMEAAPIEGGVRLSADIECDHPAIVWYNFLLSCSEGQPEYGPIEGREGGEGALWWGVQAPSFQITVYEPRAKEPEWYRGGIVYQIFPDRFRRGPEWRERVEASLEHQSKGPGRHLVEEWDTPPRYDKTEDGRIASWDIYGVTLSGIREKLGYLENLGITCIYLNPIFQAASNHRYDTADYTKIDPALGDEAEFGALCEEAAAHGIRIILDGVFNHTGADSIYFDRYGTYGGKGAYGNPKSAYADWFKLNEDGSYESWWGVDDLPDCDESSPSYRDFVFGKRGVVGRWLEAGASGWRLDVADEMPDDFIAGIASAARAVRDDALVMGEVWEDASNKISYSRLRRYFLGEELDCAMGYFWRDKVLEYLLGSAGGDELAERIETMRENYPPFAFEGSLNLLGTHDTERIFTILGGAPAKDSLADEERFAYRLRDDQRGLAKGRLWLAALLQMSLPGVPCIYYGDEAGMEGYADPYNRGPYPWEGGDADCGAIYRNAIMLRRTIPALERGSFEPLALGGDLFGFVRRDDASGSCVAVVVNRSLENVHEVRIPRLGEEACDVIAGRALKVDGDELVFELPQLGSALIHFHAHERLGADPAPGEGIICHITSLPGPEATGTLGTPALKFVDWLAKRGVRYWQLLPVSPTDNHGSPYAGLSAFAGNTRLIEGGEKRIDELVDGKLTRAEAKAFKEFCSANAAWLDPYATFVAIKDELGAGLPWTEWPKKYQAFKPALAKDKKLAPRVERERLAQFEFQRQMDALRAHARKRGVTIVGDMPIYVSADSSDVWAHRQLFDLDASGRPTLVAGCPPDQFAADGQVWGNPLYQWDAHEADGFAWWTARLERSLALYDCIRLDHFIGFCQYFAIPEGEGAAKGSYRPGPGRALFQVAYDKLGPLPVIAEDLGVITAAVRALIAECGFWGMDVLQFSDQDVANSYVPPLEKVVYASTHDTQTLPGWCAERYPDRDAKEMAEDIVERAKASGAPVVIQSLQDVLGLGDEARMNVPGTAEGNWTWRAKRLP